MKLVEVGEKLSSKDIKEMEGELNLSFPKDYKDFLLKTNGGMPEDEVEFDFIENGTSDEEEFEQGSDIHYFYDNNEIIESYENLVDEELIPDEYLPIACDSFDNQILLCLGKGDNYGAIYFADAESEESEDSGWVLSKVADSFTAFLGMLRPAED